MSGTGEKKCIPTTDSGRLVAVAIWVTGMAEVFVPSTAWAGASASSTAKTSCLTSSRSKTASTTRSALWAASARSVVVEIRARAASRSSPVSLPLATNLSYDARIPASPRSSCSSPTSRRVTS